jgi:kynurenine formamidase
MRVTVNISDYRADLNKPIDISIPVSFGKKQLSAFGGAPARRKAYKAGSFVGDVRLGGSCNCEVYEFSPHLNGTHTECVGHITKERMSVQEAAQESLLAATLLTVKPKNGVITKSMLRLDENFLDALVIRTLPNDKGKSTRDYSKSEPPYFAPEAMKYIASLGVRHLLVDFPSVDKADDAKLVNHRIFWRKNARKKTITELIYVPDGVKDGRYLLNLQVAAFEGDAAPSRPILYGVKK